MGTRDGPVQNMNKENRIHVYPLDDLREHDASLQCWCKPTQDDEAQQVWIHHSMDERENYEQGRRTQ